MRNPAGEKDKRFWTSRISDIIQDEGLMGLISSYVHYLKKLVFTCWYRTQLRVGSGSFFTGKIDVRGARYIEIGSGTVVEEGASLWVKRGSRLLIGNHCFIGKDALLNAEGNLTVGSGSYLLNRSEVSSTGDITIDPDVWIARDCKIAGKEIRLEKNVILGPSVFIFCGDHHFDKESRKIEMRASSDSRPVKLESGSWIGAQSVILKGVTIGKGAVVGAGSVVTKDVPSHALAVGVPAEVRKSVIAAKE
jgi:acetyltransferase-like isoleucine patch superfamily enzyme